MARKGAWRARVDLIDSPSVPIAPLRWSSTVRAARQVSREWYLGAAFFLIPCVLRTALLLEKSVRPGLADVDGYLSDLVVAGCFAVGASLLLRRLGERPRKVSISICAVLWTLLHVGNYEHIKALGAPLQFTYAEYMGDAVFVAGSAAVVSRALLTCALLALAVVGSIRALREGRPSAPPAQCAIVILALAFANAAWPGDERALAWRRDHFIEALLRVGTGDGGVEVGGDGKRAPLPPTFRANLRADLEGTPRLRASKERRNVLLIILEGISGGNIPVIAQAHGINNRASMPKLSAFAEKNQYFTTFITNQRQTNRGEFALLCGRMERLISMTSKMTEYARDGGEPCLPNVLGEAGYKTAYLQAAPLSFMLKDQFMAKAGFSDVRGSDFFVKGYAKSSWGVDDRALFESSVPVLQEFQKQAPWFAALLTVGTHHPYTVPKDFVAGDGLDADPHARALRYADDAVMSFIEELERQGLLDDTLLLVTSDESFGVDDYDDQTKLLSYNWGFLIVKAPEGSPGAVTAPYYQADTPISIADYLGLAGPFIGRSFFRDYQQPRQLAFGNTYQRKAYWASTSALLECDEDLRDCQRHGVNGGHIFGPERSSQRATERDIAPLRELVSATTGQQRERALGTTQLMQNNAVVYPVSPNTQGLMFGGQYFTLEADQEVAVSLSMSSAGPDFAALIDADVYARGLRYELLPPPLYEGDRLRVEYVYAPEKQERNIEIRLRARSFNGRDGRMVLDRAEMTVRPRSGEPGGRTTLFSVERGRPIETHFLVAGSTVVPGQGVRTSPCITRRATGQFRGTGCDSGTLLFGPRVKAPAGAEVRALFEIEAEKGSALLRAELVSDQGDVTHASQEIPELKDGNRRVVSLSQRLDRAVEDLDARLLLVSGDSSTALTINRAVVEVRP